MTIGFKRTLIWIAATVAAVVLSLNFLPQARYGNAYIPVGNDSFYHARRILDAVREPHSFYEFDTKMHVPEGSLLTWPWAYDYTVAQIVRGAMALGLSQDAAKTLDCVPTAALTIALALVVALCIQLNLSILATALVAMSVAFSPLTSFLFGFGVIDHHYMEYIFALASLLTGIRWLNAPTSWKDAACAGVILAIAPAFQNGLFILQLPLLIGTAYLWFRGKRMAPGPTLVFASVLIVVSFLMLLPSEPFRRFEFAYYYFSWFHLEIALSTGLAMCLFSRLQLNRTSFVIIGIVGTVLLIPLVGQIQTSRTYFASGVESAYGIGEIRSVWNLARGDGPMTVIGYYGGFILIVPLIIVGCVTYLVKHGEDAQRVLLAIGSGFGLVMLLMKFRFHPFGSIGLVLPLIVFAESLALSREKHRLTLGIGMAMACIAAVAPAVYSQAHAKKWLANDVYYQFNAEIYPILTDACARVPGVVLALSDDGHYIRYHTDCAVIANNFMLTRQHVEKLGEMQQLFSMNSKQFLATKPAVRYVFARLNHMVLAHGLASKEVVLSANPPLITELVFSPVERLDPRFKLLKELSWSIGSDGYTFARLFAIVDEPR